MTSLNFQERAQRIKEIYDGNDKPVPDILTVLWLLDDMPKSCHLGFYRGAYREVCDESFRYSSPSRRISMKTEQKSI